VNRRDLLYLGSAVIALPRAAWAQEPGRVYRLGVLDTHPRPGMAATGLFDELRRHGFIEGQNLTIDPRGYGLRSEQFPEVAVELVKAQVDVIFAASADVAIRAAQQATTTIPILGFTDDMLGTGLVTSMARPGGNLTGISLFSTELDSKRLDILIEILSGARHIAALADPMAVVPGHFQVLQDDARTRGVELSIYQINKPEEIIGAIDAAKEAGVTALNVLASPVLNAQRLLIIERAAALRLPAIYQWPETAEQGGLAAYGPRIVQLFRNEVARQLVKLLKGAKPRYAGRAADDIRAGHQPQDCPGARPYGAAIDPCPSRQGDRVSSGLAQTSG
jgi:putative tryptophan/tyrosine transport system substrate-binding protein